MSARTIVVIPARMGSSRFPGKPLVSIAGLPMIEHVRRRAALAHDVADVIVATCDESIRDAVVSSGGNVAMTAASHERCTERVEEAARGLDADIVVIVQGDEPLLLPDSVERVIAPLVEDPDVSCTNLVSPLDSGRDVGNPDVVKAACDQRQNVLFFSRAPIPYFQHQSKCPIFRQTGIMGFRMAVLRKFVTLGETPFERAEGVDMMRLLEHGHAIRAVAVPYRTVGVDHPEDVPFVEDLLREDVVQREWHERIGGKTP